MSILSGLGKFGLGDLEGQKLYGDKTSTGKKNNESAEKVTKAPEEADFLYEKKYVCFFAWFHYMFYVIWECTNCICWK